MLWSLAQPPLPADAESEVLSQASGIGVIWNSWLPVNQSAEYVPLRVKVTCDGPVWLTAVTLSGNSPGTYWEKLFFSANSMFMKNSTSVGVSFSPLDQL